MSTDTNAPVTFANPRCKATIEDWPSGRNRVLAEFWIESHPKRGERLVRQTTGKPKLQTYSQRVAIVDGSDGRTYALEETAYGFVTIVSGTLHNVETVHSSSDPIRHAALVQLISQREGGPR